MDPLFITGIGTDVGKTIVAAILAEALEADYWKPVQAGYHNGTDSEWVNDTMSNSYSKIHPETYKLSLAASPHISAREEGKTIDLNLILSDFHKYRNLNSNGMIIEGAGGLMVPLNENEFVIDLVKKMQAKVVLVSRNYLGSINHSLLTASVCKSNNLTVLGWIFNDQYMHYEDEIVRWTSIPRIASIPCLDNIGKEAILEQALSIRESLKKLMADS